MSADVHSGQFQQIDFTRTESIGKILNKSICGGSVPSHRRGAVSDSLLQGILQANTPVSIYIGALIIKELFGSSDDEMVESLMLDTRYQYALHTTNWAEQPLSDKTLSRFQSRCYECAYGVDMRHDCITLLAGKIARTLPPA